MQDEQAYEQLEELERRKGHHHDYRHVMLHLLHPAQRGAVDMMDHSDKVIKESANDYTGTNARNNTFSTSSRRHSSATFTTTSTLRGAPAPTTVVVQGQRRRARQVHRLGHGERDLDVHADRAILRHYHHYTHMAVTVCNSADCSQCSDTLKERGGYTFVYTMRSSRCTCLRNGDEFSSHGLQSKLCR